METLYRFGDEVLASALPLPSLDTVDSSDNRIRGLTLVVGLVPSGTALAWAHHWRLPDESITLSLAWIDGDPLLRVPGLCDFLLKRAARELRISPLAPLDAETIEHLLLDQVLPRWLALEGRCVLHAALADLDGGILLLGDSGAGKSTLSASLLAAGYELLSDDAVLLSLGAAGVTALATYPSIRLAPDALAGTLGTSAPATRPMAAYSDKLRIALGARLMDAPRPLRAIYVLADPSISGVEVRISPMSATAACIELLRQSFVVDLRDRARMSALLAFHAALASRVPCFSLGYPRRYDALPGVIARLRAHASGPA